MIFFIKFSLLLLYLESQSIVSDRSIKAGRESKMGEDGSGFASLGPIPAPWDPAAAAGAGGGNREFALQPRPYSLVFRFLFGTYHNMWKMRLSLCLISLSSGLSKSKDWIWLILSFLALASCVVYRWSVDVGEWGSERMSRFHAFSRNSTPQPYPCRP